MNKFRIMARLFFVGIFFILFLGGCAKWDRFFSSKEEEKTPSQLVSEGTDYLARGHYEAATKAFQKIKDRYPYSRFAVEAELKMADSLYKREQYEEALEAYGEFERLHPKNPNIPYVIYQKGMTHFEQVSTIDREQQHTLQAKDEFERLVKKFPKTNFAERARKKIRECYISLAEYELYVGHFYFKSKKYRAAAARYRYLLKNYADMGQYHEALEYLSKCKEKMAEEQRDSR
jgi:outer membrane protein assembly factor BamD